MKRTLSIILLAIFTFLAFGSSENSDNSTKKNGNSVSSCKRECQDGYDKAVEKLRRNGHTPGNWEIQTLRDCKTECERDPNW